MEVQCPNCLTRFRVDSGQLRPEGTRARCSHCGHRFLVFPEGAPESIAPEAQEGPDGAEQPSAQPDQLAPADNHAAATDESSPSGPSAAKGRIPSGSGRSSDRQKSGRGRRATSFLLGLLVLLLVAGLLLELGYAFRNQLFAQPWVRATVQKGLDAAGMEWQLPVALSRYRVEGVAARMVTLSSGRRVTLMEGRLVNSAPFAQPSPRLELRADTPGSGVRYRRVKGPGEPFPITGELGAEQLRRRWERSRAAFPRSLDPGQSKPFVVVLADVPPGSRRFQVELVR